MAKRQWIDVVESYKELPDYIPNNRLIKLVKILKRGDRSVSDEIIRGHLKLGLSIIQRMSFPDKEDLVGEMEFAVTKAVWQVSRGTLTRDNNITAYISSYVTYILNEYIKTCNRAVSVPTRTVRYWNAKFKKVKTCNRISIVEGEPFKEDDSGERIRLKQHAKFHTPKTDDNLEEVDLREIIDKVTYSKSEKRIIELRESGYGIEEIGNIVGYSKSAVHKLLHQIEGRFDHYMKDAE